jgi:UDP-sulfoquinovose synthase
MRVLIAGIDGYIGWPLALCLAQRGHDVYGLDNGFRRTAAYSANPIAKIEDRAAYLRSQSHSSLVATLDLSDLSQHEALVSFLRQTQPDTVVHLGQIPSAPFSMRDWRTATETQRNNTIGNLHLLYALHEAAPNAHLLKLGTMGEYGCPDIDIPEGFFDVEYRGRQTALPFPKQAGSWYHQSKVHDSNNIALACKIWDLRCTDVMQGVVYGTRTGTQTRTPSLIESTRLDFDSDWGTAIHRFVCQAVAGKHLTVYGAGHQTRGFLPLRDSVQCLTLALENPPEPGEYRVFNQFEETYQILDLANRVRKIASGVDPTLDPKIAHLANPRVEAEEHYYRPDHQKLFRLGYVPTNDIDGEITRIFEDLAPWKERICSALSGDEGYANWRQ